MELEDTTCEDSIDVCGPADRQILAEMGSTTLCIRCKCVQLTVQSLIQAQEPICYECEHKECMRLLTLECNYYYPTTTTTSSLTIIYIYRW